jgi:hypothetical protein
MAAASAPAYADVPEGWSDPEPVSLVAMLIVILVIPTLMFVVISLLAFAPQAAKRRREGSAESAPTEVGAGPQPPALETSRAD